MATNARKKSALAVAFVLIVFLVILPAQNSGQNKASTHVVDASDQAKAVNALNPGGFVPTRPTPIAYRVLPTPTLMPAPLTLATPTPTPDDRLAIIQKALTFQTRAVNVEHPVPSATPASVPAAWTRPPEDYNALMARAQEAKGALEGAGNHGVSQQPSLSDYDNPNPARRHSPNTVENPVKYQLRAGFVVRERRAIAAPGHEQRAGSLRSGEDLKAWRLKHGLYLGEVGELPGLHQTKQLGEHSQVNAPEVKLGCLWPTTADRNGARAQSACGPSTLFSSTLPVLASTPISCVTRPFSISKE